MRILLVEDDKELSRAVVSQLKSDGYNVDIANDGEEGLFYINEGDYDLVILDRMMPNMDGLTLLSRMRRKDIITPVLMMTALGSIENRVEGLDYGADDYLTKPFDSRELLARVRALLRRPGQIQDNKKLRFGDIFLDESSLFLEGNRGRCTLSKKESEILSMLIKSEGKTLTRQAMFAHVWGVGAEVEEASLDSYAYYVRRRLSHVSEEVSLVTVRGVGYRLYKKDSRDEYA